jgi:hypothetical protein
LVFNSSTISFSGGLRDFDFLPAVRLHGQAASPSEEDSVDRRTTDLRDNSDMGQRRRRVFGELIDYLQAVGMPTSEARAHLLLALKMWRNEIGDDASLRSIPPEDERSRILSATLDRLVKAGLSPEQAKAKILEALKTWKSTP